MTLGRQGHEGCGLGCEAEAWAPGQHLVWAGREAPLRVHALHMLGRAFTSMWRVCGRLAQYT